ncbi:hypothetical protein [Streptomyces sp. NPDC003635]
MLRPTTWTYGRAGALLTASAAAVCLGGLLAACAGDGGGDGYVAVGAPGAVPATAAPTGEVTLVPLEPEGRATEGDSRTEHEDSGQEPSSAPPAPGDPPNPAPSAARANPGRTPASSAAPTPSGSATAAPAALTWSEPERAGAQQRWCEKVTLEFHNSGGDPVRSGTVTFGTHIIGALGVDWGTVESAEELPAPIEGGARKGKTWTVCVDAWRVPLGMHVETRDVTVRWEG